MIDSALLVFATAYLVVGLGFVAVLSFWEGKVPSNWWKYPALIFGWPVILALAYAGRL